MNHVISTNPQIPFNLPDALEDILPLVEIEESKGLSGAEAVLGSIKDINALVIIDEDNFNPAQFLGGEHTFQVLSMALQSLIDDTQNEAYCRKVVNLFHLDDYLIIPEKRVA
jgi:hypothetical protein